MLVDTFEADLVSPPNNTFLDVLKERPSYPYVEASKDFLTGYMNPFGGKPLFQPEEDATREDITVSLVRIIGLIDSDVQNPSYASSVFSDADDISPNLFNYVSLAAERKLISGYSDGTLQPTKGVSRAEAVVLLNRATKQAVTDIGLELQLSANVIYGDDPKEVTINIQAEEGTKVTIDGKNVRMSSNKYDEYEGSYVYKFTQEGTKTFKVDGKKPGKTKSIDVTAKCGIDLPELDITNCPTDVTTPKVKLEGTMYDKNYSTSLTINGESIENNRSSDFTKKWSKDYVLEEGDNTFEFVLENSEGKKITETRIINFNVDAPRLIITNCPTYVTVPKVKLEGTMYDKNYPTSLTIDGKSVANNRRADKTSNWSESFELVEGENTLEFVLTNEVGKTTKETRTINFTAEGPRLNIINAPTNVTTKKVILKGTMYDKIYSTSLMINGESVKSYNKADNLADWSKEFELREGENIFEFELKNKNDKVTKETRTIYFTADAPKLEVGKLPENAKAGDKVKLKVITSDENYSTSLTINGEIVRVYNNTGKKNLFENNYELVEGENTFEIVLANSEGKETKEKITITATAN